jgi:hypothetical protein
MKESLFDFLCPFEFRPRFFNVGICPRIVTSAVSLSPANTDVAKVKKAILQKKRTIGPDSTQPTVSRQSNGISKVSGRIPTAPLPGFVAPMQAMLADSIRPGNWIYEINQGGIIVTS